MVECKGRMITKSKVVIFGYDELLLESLKFISQTQTRIAAVVFPSSRNDWRANKIRQIVTGQGFPILEQPPAGRISEFARQLREIQPDLIYVWSYPMILPEEIIKIPKYGCINVHLGLLPEYRGVNGVRWALLNGEEKTGVTIHFMDSGIDSGKIISRVTFPITPKDDILSLMKKSKIAGLHLLENSWSRIASGKAEAIEQDESKANYYSAKTPIPETIDWSKSNVDIHNLIRASVAPFPGVSTFWNGLKIFVNQSAPLRDFSSSAHFGTIEKIDQSGALVTTGNGKLLVTEIKSEEKLILNTELYDFGFRPGDQLQNA